MPGRPLHGAHARTIERLLGLEEPRTLRAVEHAGRDYVLRFKQQPFGAGGHSRRVWRIPATRVIGYQRRSATVRPSDVRRRADLSRRSFAHWLERKLGIYTPVVWRALAERDLAAIDELREQILLAAGAGAGLMEIWRAGARPPLSAGGSPRERLGALPAPEPPDEPSNGRTAPRPKPRPAA